MIGCHATLNDDDDTPLHSTPEGGISGAEIKVKKDFNVVDINFLRKKLEKKTGGKFNLEVNLNHLILQGLILTLTCRLTLL